MQQKSKLYGFLAFASDDPLHRNQVTHRCVADKEGNIFHLFAVLMNTHRLISWFNKNPFYQN